MYGLDLVFENELSEADHRCCLRYLYANLKSAGFKGKALKDALWTTTIATNRTAFDAFMLKIEVICPGAHHKLLVIDLALWSKHAFGIGCKSEMLLNNLAKMFNAWTREAPDKPVITRCEVIRRQLLIRFYKKKQGAEVVIR